MTDIVQTQKTSQKNHPIGPSLRRLCVFCGSSLGRRNEYAEAAQRLGKTIAKRGLALVYGGAGIGLMGRVADAQLLAGGEAIGVIPENLADKEVAHGNLTRLEIVPSIYDRKAMMFELADGFITMPGGIGTLDELFEAYTWTQLNIHRKPCGVLNICGYYDKLLNFLDHQVTQGFLMEEFRAILIVDDDPARLIDRMERYQQPAVDKLARRHRP